MPCLSNRGFYRGQNHQKCKQMINNRKLTLFQRAIYANSCLLSKVWYITHIYPFTQYYAKEHLTIYGMDHMSQYEGALYTDLERKEV